MSQYVPEAQRDTAWYLFNELYECRVSNIQSLSVEHIRHHGMVTTGNPVMDREMANALVHRWMTIVAMADLFSKSINVYICNIEDTKKIYDRVTDHLVAWKNELERTLNTRGAPIKSLLVLDKFASALYPHAQPLFTTTTVESIMARKLSTAMRVSISDLMANAPANRPATTTNQEGQVVPERPQYQSMAEAFNLHNAVKTGDKKWS